MSDLSLVSRQRVLLVTRNLPPLRGGMERLNQHMALELAKEFSVAIVGPRGCGAFLPASIDVREVSAKPLWRFFLGALSCSLSTAWRFRPDVVLAGSGLAAPFAWLAAKMVRAHFVVYVHGLDLIANHVIYRCLWRPFIRRADLCIANSNYTAQLAVGIGVPQSRIAIVHPGVDMPVPETTANDFRVRFDLGDRPLLLSVGRLIARKGLLEFVENALPQIVARFPDVCLMVLGDETPDLLHGSSAGLGECIRQRAAALGTEHNLRFIGPQDDATLASAYRASDVHVFPVREIACDVEGFGMVAVEAAAQGLPTVAFAVGGVPDAIADGVSGYVVAAGDYANMASRIVELLNQRNISTLGGAARAFAERFRRENFGTQIRRRICSSVGDAQLK
ncbi:MAG: glycosyltransferase family 4 protein [Rudaea sp.]